MAVLVQIPRLVARMVVVLAGDFLLTSLIAVAVLVEIAGLVARVIVMLAGLFLWHCFLLMLFRTRYEA